MTPEQLEVLDDLARLKHLDGEGRYAAESMTTGDADGTTVRVRDRVTGLYLTASQVEAYLNVAERRRRAAELVTGLLFGDAR